MISYRITKYDPKKRDDNGAYTDRTDWISISDIGKSEYNNPTFNQYFEIENCYVYAIRLILQEKKVDKLRIDSLELYTESEGFDKLKSEGVLEKLSFDYNNDIKILTNGFQLNQEQIDKTVRLILRETIWMLLIDSSFELKFGFDYYMYVKCEELTKETIEQIEQAGLYVEPNVGQIEYDIVYDD